MSSEFASLNPELRKGFVRWSAVGIVLQERALLLEDGSLASLGH